jgi:hypothetical protein
VGDFSGDGKPDYVLSNGSGGFRLFTPLEVRGIRQCFSLLAFAVCQLI